MSGHNLSSPQTVTRGFARCITCRSGAPGGVEAAAGRFTKALNMLDKWEVWGLYVEGAEDEDFGLGRPNTQMSMQAETRFVGSQY